MMHYSLSLHLEDIRACSRIRKRSDPTSTAAERIAYAGPSSDIDNPSGDSKYVDCSRVAVSVVSLQTH